MYGGGTATGIMSDTYVMVIGWYIPRLGGREDNGGGYGGWCGDEGGGAEGGGGIGNKMGK